MPPADLQLPPAEARDPLERFQAVGFLRWEKVLSGPGRYVVEGQVAEANIKDASDAIWWGFVTITTVGYGDR